MAIRRNIVIGSATLLAVLGTATIAAAANVASGTLYGTDTGKISTTGCSAGVWASTSNDTAATSALVNGCSSVTLKIYYANPHGYAGWSNTRSNASYIQTSLSGDDELVKTYHTAIARSSTAQ